MSMKRQIDTVSVAHPVPVELSFTAALQGSACIAFDGDKAAKVKFAVDASFAPTLAIMAMEFTEQELEVTIRRKG